MSSTVLIHWLDPKTNTVKHACDIRFDEYNIPLTSDNTPPHGTVFPWSSFKPSFTKSWSWPHRSPLPLLYHFSTWHYSATLGHTLGCELGTCLYNNLPHISHLTKGSNLAHLFSLHGAHNSTFWILSLHSKEFSLAPSVASYVHSLQQPHTTTVITSYFAKCKVVTRTTYEDNCTIFKKTKLSNISTQHLSSSCRWIPIPIPMGMNVIIFLTRSIAPNHTGKLHNNPYYANWK